MVLVVADRGVQQLGPRAAAAADAPADAPPEWKPAWAASDEEARRGTRRRRRCALTRAVRAIARARVPTQGPYEEPAPAAPHADNPAAPLCRICHEPGGGGAQPLLRPCACSGSMALVHDGCLAQWRQTSAAAYERCSICGVAYRGREASRLQFLRQRGLGMLYDGGAHLFKAPCRHVGCVEARALVGVARFAAVATALGYLFSALDAQDAAAASPRTGPRELAGAAMLLSTGPRRQGRPAALHELLALLHCTTPRCLAEMAFVVVFLVPALGWLLRMALHAAGAVPMWVLTPAPMSGGGFAFNLTLLAAGHCLCTLGCVAWAEARAELRRWRLSRGTVEEFAVVKRGGC